jgi:hypothetical protein
MSITLLRTPDARNYASAEMLQLISTFEGNADATARQKAIDYLVKIHGMSLATTKSLRYEAGFTAKDGRNVKGDIKIGPLAFAQDSSWLANVVFHETVHSDQFSTYDKQGVGSINPQNSQPERILVALDEYEAFYSSWFNRRPLGLDKDQTSSLERELGLWLIEIDDKTTVELARRAQFDAARTALIGKIPSAARQKGAPTAQVSARPLSPGRSSCHQIA